MIRYFNEMKKFWLFVMLIIMLASCGSSRYLSSRSVREMDEISYVLANYYPQLHTYYMEGVLDVDYIREVTLEDGTVDYKVKYHFIKYYYSNHADMMETLKQHFPELYQLYVSGSIEINSLYKYVEKSTGKIRYHCSYGRIYDYYYHYYPRFGGSHIYYRPRPVPPPPRPRVEPNRPPHSQGNRPPQNRPPQGGRRGR